MTASGRITETRRARPGEMFVYRSAAPCAALAGVVRLLWDAEGAATNINERILPTSDVVIIIDRHPRAISGALVCGLQTGPILSETPAESFFTGARLSPLGAFKALDAAASTLTGGLVDLAALLPHDAESLRDELMSEPSPAGRIAALERFLIRRLTRGPAWHGAAAGAWALLTRWHGAVRVEAAADAVGLSSRQLGRIFREQIGLGPKTVARLLRFEHAMALMRAPGCSLADAAAAAGFADQAHFAREFQSFAGVSPRRYLAGRLDAGDRAFMRDRG